MEQRKFGSLRISKKRTDQKPINIHRLYLWPFLRKLNLNYVNIHDIAKVKFRKFFFQ